MMLVAATAFTILAPSAGAQTYPDRLIRFVVAYNPGGATDVLARLLAQKLTPILGQPIVVENRPGASGMIGAQLVAKAAPDGYTLLVGGPNETALNVALFKSMPYNPRTDLEPITLIMVAPVVLVTAPTSEFKTLQDVVKAGLSPNPPDFGSVGIGTPNHIAGELLNSMAKTDLQHIPYPGAAPATQAVVGGHVPLAMLSLASAATHINAGTLRPLAVTTTKRFPGQPDIPTVAEQGFEGFNISTWYGLLAPAKTPPDVVNRLATEIGKILKEPEVQKQILGLGADVVGSTPAEFGSFINTEIDKYRDLAQRAKIEPQ
jgi:tripartite-type tricarboxylate transporter receptor subunit TctC